MGKNRKIYFRNYMRKYRLLDRYKNYQKEYGKKYRKTDKYKQRKNQYMKEYQKTDKYNQYMKEYRKTAKRKQYEREYRKERRRKNPKYRLDRNLTSAICIALKGNKNFRKWQDLVGYSVDDLMRHLENKFEKWMSWDNYGLWEIDHIIPKSHFKYTTAEDPEFKKCWALENLQPLERMANIKKGDKY